MAPLSCKSLNALWAPTAVRKMAYAVLVDLLSSWHSNWLESLHITDLLRGLDGDRFAAVTFARPQGHLISDDWAAILMSRRCTINTMRVFLAMLSVVAWDFSASCPTGHHDKQH